MAVSAHQGDSFSTSQSKSLLRRSDPTRDSNSVNALDVVKQALGGFNQAAITSLATSGEVCLPKSESPTQEQRSWLPDSLRSSVSEYLSPHSVDFEQTFDCSTLFPGSIDSQKTFVQLFKSQISSIVDSPKTPVEKLKLLAELINDPLFDVFDKDPKESKIPGPLFEQFKEIYTHCHFAMGEIVNTDMAVFTREKVDGYLTFFQNKDSKSRLHDDVFKVFFKALPKEDQTALEVFFNNNLIKFSFEPENVYGSLSFSLKGAEVMVQKAKEKCHGAGEWASLTIEDFPAKLAQIQSQPGNYTGYYYPVLRQMDPETCLVFALRDLVQLSKMSQENPEMSVFDRIISLEDSPGVVKELPAPMRRLVQPSKDIRTYKESMAEGDKSIRTCFKRSWVNSVELGSKMKWVLMNPRAELRKVKYMAQVIQGYFEGKSKATAEGSPRV